MPVFDVSVLHLGEVITQNKPTIFTLLTPRQCKAAGLLGCTKSLAAMLREKGNWISRLAPETEIVASRVDVNIIRFVKVPLTHVVGRVTEFSLVRVIVSIRT